MYILTKYYHMLLTGSYLIWLSLKFEYTVLTLVLESTLNSSSSHVQNLSSPTPRLTNIHIYGDHRNFIRKVLSAIIPKKKAWTEMIDTVIYNNQLVFVCKMIISCVIHILRLHRMVDSHLLGA